MSQLNGPGTRRKVIGFYGKNRGLESFLLLCIYCALRRRSRALRPRRPENEERIGWLLLILTIIQANRPFAREKIAFSVQRIAWPARRKQSLPPANHHIYLLFLHFLIAYTPPPDQVEGKLRWHKFGALESAYSVSAEGGEMVDLRSA